MKEFYSLAKSNGTTKYNHSIAFIVLFYGWFALTGCSTLTEENVTVDLKLDPYGQAPLSALATISLPNLESYDVSVQVLGKPENNGETDSVRSGITIGTKFLNQQKNFSVPVLGLYPNYKNQLRFTFSQEGTSLLSIEKELTTAPLPTNIVVPMEVYINRLPKEGAIAEEIFLVDNLKVGFDQHAQIRWAYTGDSFLNYGKLANGNLLIMSAKDLRFQYHYPMFYEVSMLGEVIFTYDISDYYGHHDVVEITSGKYAGDLLVAVNEAAPGTTADAGNDGVYEEDVVLLLERGTGEVLKVWDIKKLFYEAEPNLHRLPQSKMEHPDDWIHLNALFYDDSDDSIIFSARHLSVVVKFDFESGRLVWVITDNRGKHWDEHINAYGQRITDFILEPINLADEEQNDFWTYGQHAVKRVQKNDIDDFNEEYILLYDNGNYRNYFSKPFNPDVRYHNFPRYSRAVEYRINRRNMSIAKVWDFDAEKKYYTIATGSVDELANGNRLVGFMWTTPDQKTPRIYELTPNDEVVFEARFNEGKNFYYQIEKFHPYLGVTALDNTTK